MGRERTLRRRCLLCGRELEIKIRPDGGYEGGHYFGVLHLPKKYLKGDLRDHPNYVGEDEEEVKLEYWECDACFAE